MNSQISLEDEANISLSICILPKRELCTAFPTTGNYILSRPDGEAALARLHAWIEIYLTLSPVARNL